MMVHERCLLWDSSDKEYQGRLPKKRMSAGALFWDETGRVLLVEPVYKRHWEIPGGVVELDGRLNPRLTKRVQMAAKAGVLEQTFYLENQSLSD